MVHTGLQPPTQQQSEVQLWASLSNRKWQNFLQLSQSLVVSHWSLARRRGRGINWARHRTRSPPGYPEGLKGQRSRSMMLQGSRMDWWTDRRGVEIWIMARQMTRLDNGWTCSQVKISFLFFSLLLCSELSQNYYFVYIVQSIDRKSFIVNASCSSIAPLSGKEPCALRGWSLNIKFGGETMKVGRTIKQTNRQSWIDWPLGLSERGEILITSCSSSSSFPSWRPSNWSMGSCVANGARGRSSSSLLPRLRPACREWHSDLATSDFAMTFDQLS